MRLRFLAVLLAISAGTASAADTADALLRDGNLAFREGRFSDAAARYEETRARGLASGPLYYNLGNAYYRLGDLGRAMANYQRALRYLPRDEDLRANIEFVRSRSLDRAMVANRFPLLRLLGDLAGRLTWKEWLLLWEAVYAALLAVVGLFLFRPGLRTRLRPVLQTLAALFLMLLLFLGRALQDQVIVCKAVVIPGEVAARSGPGSRFTEEFVLHQGTVLRVEREIEAWVFVAVTPDLKGWIPSDTVERI